MPGDVGGGRTLGLGLDGRVGVAFSVLIFMHTVHLTKPRTQRRQVYRLNPHVWHTGEAREKSHFSCSQSSRCSFFRLLAQVVVSIALHNCRSLLVEIDKLRPPFMFPVDAGNPTFELGQHRKTPGLRRERNRAGCPVPLHL